MDKEYKIYVNNLPEELNEDAIREIFNSYGKITGMFYRPTWAYITYGTYREAELAIRELDNKKPLYMKVALAKDKSAVNETFQRFCISETEEKPDKKLIYIHEKPASYSIGRGNTIGRHLPLPGNIKSHRLAQDEERIQCFPLSAAASVYGNDELYASTNRLWTRGVITLTEDGRRHVTLGRGFTKYEIPEPHPKIEKYITKVVELRQKGLYEYSDDKLKNELQICIVCSARAMKHCEKCFTYYCSKACQVTHWPRHQVECERIPDLVEDEISPAQVDTNVNESTKPNSVNTHVNTPNDEVKLRRPNTPVKIQGLATNTQRSLINKTNEDAVPTSKPSVQFETNNNMPTEKKVDQPAVDAANRAQSISDRLLRYNSNENVDQSRRNDQFLPASNLTRPNYYNRGYKNDATSKSTPDRETNKNGNVRDRFNRDDRSYPHQRDEFQNARRSSYNYRDTGNKQGQRVSMQSMDADKTMAVEMEERSGGAARTITNSQSGGVNNATLKASQETPSSSSLNTGRLPPIQLPNLLDAIDNLLIENAVSELEVEGGIEFMNRMEKNVYLGSLVLHQHAENLAKVLDDLSVICINMKEAAANYKPQVGDLICGEIKTGIWRRGYVITLSPDLLMAVVDEPKTMPVNQFVPCPKELLNICTFGVICEVNNAELLENMYIINAVVNKHNKKQGSFKAKLLTYNENNEIITSIEAVIKPWQPTMLKSVPVPKSSPLPAPQSAPISVSRPIPALLELNNGEKVFLVSYQNPFSLFVHSTDPVKVEYANNILQCVAHYAQTAPRLSKPPHIEQIVIAPFDSDDNNYRAFIMEIRGNTAKIVYIDYGNVDEINVSELREISDDLAAQPSCGTTLMLKDVPQNVPATQQVNAYLSSLMEKPEHLIYTYDDKSPKDGVYLTTSDGERINDKIKQLLIPSWKRENNEVADKTCYVLNDIETVSLGNTGDTIEAMVLYQKNHRLFMSPLDTDLIQHVTEVMPGLMKEYCEKMEYYIPRKQELCLALYEGDWYRAMCLVPKVAQGISEIYFLDYGNIEEVEHTNVRLMHEDFMKPQTLANICTVVNLAPVDSEGKYSDAVNQKLSELVNCSTKVKIVECVEYGEYKVELPELHAILVKENLVKISPPSF